MIINRKYYRGICIDKSMSKRDLLEVIEYLSSEIDSLRKRIAEHHDAIIDSEVKSFIETKFQDIKVNGYPLPDDYEFLSKGIFND